MHLGQVYLGFTNPLDSLYCGSKRNVGYLLVVWHTGTGGLQNLKAMKYIKLIFFLVLLNSLAYGEKTVSDIAMLEIDYKKKT